MTTMELWHALNHSIEGRDLFLDSQDYARFVHNLYEFNDSNPAGNLYRLFDPSGMRDFVNPSFRKTRELLVDVHGWVLMKDHYHLILSGRVENGISLFLRKVNIGYANYVNERYERHGTLFQGRTKKILIEHQAHFLYILHYLHLNPLDYLNGAEKWRVRSKGGIKNANEALAYLGSYKWSSYLDYTGKKNFPSIITTTLFKNDFSDYLNSLKEYLYDAEYDNGMTKLILE
jgi:putative transposase